MVALPCSFAQAVKRGSDECQLRPAMHVSCEDVIAQFIIRASVGIEISIRPV